MAYESDFDFNLFNVNEEIFVTKNNQLLKKYDKNIELQKSNKWRECPNCNVEATKDNEISLSCPKCGLQIDVIHDTIQNFNLNKQYNTSENNITTKMDGKNTYKFNKTLHSTCGQSNWNPKIIINKLNKISYESIENEIPKYIIHSVVEQFKEIRKIKTLRGNGQMAVLISLIYYKCKEEGLAYKPKELAIMYNISERDMSKADSNLRSLHNKGIIELELNNNNYKNFIERYLLLLNIDSDKYNNIENWKKIILEIIECAERKNIYIINTPKPSTKCVGAIFLFINSTPELKDYISKDDIVKKCKISKTTFIGHYQLLLENSKKFKKVFKKNGLEFPK